MKRWIYIVAAFIIMFALIKQCGGEPKVVTKTVTKVIKVHDTITEVKIDTIYTQVFIDKVKTVKGKDSIIYKDKPSEATIIAKQYNTELKSNEAEAKLKITTSGELLDVQGVITYQQKETIKETTIIRDASGFYIYAQMPISSQLINPELGVMLQIKNKIIIGVGANYNNNLNAVGTIAVKL